MGQFAMAEKSKNANGLTRGERLQIMLAPEELEVIDDFRFKWRMPSRAATVRELLKRGLAAEGVLGTGLRQSKGFGVIEDVGNSGA
jgi:hypothetical protein